MSALRNLHVTIFDSEICLTWLDVFNPHFHCNLICFCKAGRVSYFVFPTLDSVEGKEGIGTEDLIQAPKHIFVLSRSDKYALGNSDSAGAKPICNTDQILHYVTSTHHENDIISRDNHPYGIKPRDNRRPMKQKKKEKEKKKRLSRLTVTNMISPEP